MVFPLRATTTIHFVNKIYIWLLIIRGNVAVLGRVLMCTSEYMTSS
jgi:hypothetical protein